ncbi:piggyBac transposable element-derived protein 4-like [Eriocheir sinensis]|uniref:piggyBac transposable element-derived protein 4-like n=1 Tax=Eriocheir sinensis TaxID=95602 RepID=UPI0021C65F95|nr:piggyBac transposable element-derived protein 4-like [Eriocheir sinensis]
MASSLSSESDSEGDLAHLEELQGSDDNETQSEGFISDSDEEYLPENDSEASSYEEESDGSVDDADRPRSPALPAPLHAFTLMADPFADQRPGTVPVLTEDFSGVHPDVPRNDMSALDCFELFMSDEVIQSLCLWTNVRATKFFRDNPTINPNKFMGKKWLDVTKDEMNVFLCLQLLMGVNKLPKIADYWSLSVLCQGPPVFTAAVMSRNRFSQIQRFIRYSHPDDSKKEDPMTRLSSFFNMLREKTTKYFSAGENFAVDESLILYKGRLRFRQYIKTKRKRFGLKLFSLCPSSPKARGYTWNFCLYSHRLYDEMLDNPELSALSKSERVPVYLMLDLLNKGRHVVLDNWYSSLHLAEFLLERGTLTTGTIRPNRGVPPIMKNESLSRGQALFSRKDEILQVKFRDTKCVHVITTKYEAGFVERTRVLKGGKQEFIKKPSPIQRYNEQMGAVDLVDQLLEPPDPTRKSYTWFKKLGLHMISRMLLNARTIYCNLHQQRHWMEYGEFIKLVVHQQLTRCSPGYRQLCSERKKDLSLRKKKSAMVEEPRE